MSDVADQQIKSVANFVARPRELKRFCVLPAGRELAIDTTKSRFPFVKRLFFETQREVLKSTIRNPKSGSVPELLSGSQIIHLRCPTRSVTAGSGFPS